MAQDYTIFVRDFQTSLFPQYILTHLWNTSGVVNTKAQIGMANRNKVLEYIIPPGDWEHLQTQVHERTAADRNFIPQAVRQARAAVDALNEYTEQQIAQKDLTCASNEELAEIYRRYFELNIPCYGYGNIIFIIEFGERAYFSNQIKQLLAARAPEQPAAYFTLLTTPAEPHIFQEQSLALLQLASAIELQTEIKDWFLANAGAGIEHQLLAKYPAVLEQFQKHRAAYYWLFYSWEGPALTVGDFVMFAVDILRRGSAGAQLAEKKAEQATLGTRQEKIMQELHFSEEERWWVKMAQLCAAFQPYRKARQFKSCSHMEKYFREVARRLYISLDQARYLTHYEVAEALRKGEVDTNLLNERRKFFVYIFDNNQPRCLTGSPAEAWYQEHVAQEMHQFSGELRGTVACPGRATGKVRMVNSYEEGQQFQPGEILVSFSTNPTLLPAMRLAAAIITEEGGLTCHAAIVSRELNIPCVVGIKGIVSGLQTGETIEVDAIKGLVKKLS